MKLKKYQFICLIISIIVFLLNMLNVVFTLNGHSNSMILNSVGTITTIGFISVMLITWFGDK